MLENIYPCTFRGPTPAPDYFFKICQTFKSNTHRLKRRPLHIRKIKKFTKVLGFDTITIEGYMLPKICTRFISLYPNLLVCLYILYLIHNLRPTFPVRLCASFYQSQRVLGKLTAGLNKLCNLIHFWKISQQITMIHISTTNQPIEILTYNNFCNILIYISKNYWNYLGREKAQIRRSITNLTSRIFTCSCPS